MTPADWLALLFLLGTAVLLITGIIFLVMKRYRKGVITFGIMTVSFILFLISMNFVPTVESEVVAEEDQEIELSAKVENAIFNTKNATISTVVSTNLPEDTLVNLHLQSEEQNAAEQGVTLLIDHQVAVKEGKLTVKDAPVSLDSHIPQENMLYNLSLDIFVGDGVNEDKAELTTKYSNAETHDFETEEVVSLDNADSIIVKEGFTAEQVKKMTAEAERKQKEEEEKALQSKKDSAKTVRYGEIEKNPDAFIGEYMKFQGEIVQIMEDGIQADIRLSVTKESYGYSLNDII